GRRPAGPRMASWARWYLRAVTGAGADRPSRRRVGERLERGRLGQGPGQQGRAAQLHVVRAERPPIGAHRFPRRDQAPRARVIVRASQRAAEVAGPLGERVESLVGRGQERRLLALVDRESEYHQHPRYGSSDDPTWAPGDADTRRQDQGVPG